MALALLLLGLFFPPPAVPGWVCIACNRALRAFDMGLDGPRTVMGGSVSPCPDFAFDFDDVRRLREAVALALFVTTTLAVWLLAFFKAGSLSSSPSAARAALAAPRALLVVARDL